MLRVTALYRYPVKGLSPEVLPHAEIAPGAALAHDRAYAIENGPSGFDEAAPRRLPKTRFLCLMRNAKLAALSSRYDAATGELEITAPDGSAVSGRLDEAPGRDAIERFMAAFVADELDGPPRILHAAGHTFSDSGEAVLSFINLASVTALEARMGVTLDPVRFRGNVVFEGLEPFAEFDLVGKRLAGADGLVLEGTRRIRRCPATSVDPATGIRDLDVPQGLREAFGHVDCGVYMKALSGGTIRLGDRLQPA